MNDSMFDWYRNSRDRINIVRGFIRDGMDGSEEHLEELICALEIMELAYPDLKVRYEKLIAIQKSFTPEQVDFICYQIGDWYLDWKNRIIVDLENGTHRLGFAKEKLKTMICGE